MRFLNSLRYRFKFRFFLRNVGAKALKKRVSNNLFYVNLGTKKIGESNKKKFLVLLYPESKFQVIFHCSNPSTSIHLDLNTLLPLLHFSEEDRKPLFSRKKITTLLYKCSANQFTFITIRT